MKSIITIVLATALMASCGGNKTTDTTFTTDSVKYENKDKMAEVTIRADYPKSGNELLTNAIEEYINEALGGTFTGELKNGNAVVTYYANETGANIKKDAEEYWNDNMSPRLYNHSFKKEYETDRLVTYTSSCDTYMGGAHGLHVFYGTTFRKSDGRRFGIEMLRDTDKDSFRLLIKDGLKEYFSDQDGKTMSDDSLKNLLITENDVNYLPLPQSAPYLTKDGVAFVYQAYEIAPYAAGLPTFVIPYDKIKSYMTVTAWRLVDVE